MRITIQMNEEYRDRHGEEAYVHSWQERCSQEHHIDQMKKLMHQLIQVQWRLPPCLHASIMQWFTGRRDSKEMDLRQEFNQNNDIDKASSICIIVRFLAGRFWKALTVQYNGSVDRVLYSKTDPLKTPRAKYGKMARSNHWCKCHTSFHGKQYHQ